MKKILFAIDNRNELLNRGKYILHLDQYGAWVYNDATGTEASSCVMGDIGYFIRLVEQNPDEYKLTLEGKNIKQIYDNCNKGIKCSYCNNANCILHGEREAKQ